jgi:hypothetical protein
MASSSHVSHSQCHSSLHFATLVLLIESSSTLHCCSHYSNSPFTQHSYHFLTLSPSLSPINTHTHNHFKMCHEVHSIYKCGYVIVRPTFCNDSVNRTLCDVVSTEQKRLELKCSRCHQEALKKLTTAAAVPKQNPAIEIPLPTSNKRKATPEQEQGQERPAKKAKTQAEIKAKREKSPKHQHRKKLEYKKKYRQAQAAKKLAAEQEKKKVGALAMQAESEIAALSRAHAAEAQRQNDEEMTEEGILTPSEEREEESEDADDEASDSDSVSEFSFSSSSSSSSSIHLPTPPPSPSTTPTLLTLRHNQPRHYHIPTADLLPCHGYYFRIPRLAPWDNPLGEDGGYCKNCWLKVDGYTIKDMDREEKDGEGIKVAVLVRAWEMFEAGYWSEAD